MSRIVINPKLKGETRKVQFDFSSSLGAGETISTQSVAAFVYSGVDASPSAIVNGSVSSNDPGTGSPLPSTITAW